MNKNKKLLFVFGAAVLILAAVIVLKVASGYSKQQMSQVTGTDYSQVFKCIRPVSVEELGSNYIDLESGVINLRDTGLAKINRLAIIRLNSDEALFIRSIHERNEAVRIRDETIKRLDDAVRQRDSLRQKIKEHR